MRLLAALLLGLLAVPVHGQTQYPSKPIKLIVPFPPGGPTDVVARALAQRMRLEQPVLVENRAGAGGRMGLEVAARSEGDGHTLVIGSLGTLAAAPSLYPGLGYDPAKSFRPISLLAKAYLVVAAHASVPVQSLPELIHLARSRPGGLHLGSPGTGTGPHIAGEMLKQTAGVELVHVPYKGAGPLVVDLAAGRVEVALETLASLQAHLQSGRIRALAVTAAKRLPQLPDVPTATEAGVAGYEFSVWFGLLAPSATPSAIIARLNSEVQQALASAELRELLSTQGLEAASTSPEEFAAFIGAEEARLSRAIRASSFARSSP